jgi:predicted transcriptional regulator
VALARDLMTPKPVTLESSTTILEAVDTFIKKKYSSVPILTTMGDVGGQLTEMVMVRILVLAQLQPDKYKKLVNCLDLLEPAIFVKDDETIAMVIKAMLKSTSRRVLVQGDGRQIKGIISPKDLLRMLMSGDSAASSVRAEIVKMNKP